MKTTRVILALVFLVTFGSCKEFLVTEPTDFLSPSNYYRTEQQLEFARAGVYSTLGENPFYGHQAHYLYAWDADMAYMNRFTLTTGPWNYFYSPADRYNDSYWSNLYDGINRANVVLANVDNNPEIDQKKRDVIRGEMLFLRAFYYFMLVQYYGGVPIRTEPTLSVEDVDIARATVKENYDQIVKDMTQAEPLVPDITAIGFGGAISKSAVRGLLARVNLTMAGEPLKDQSRYAEAKKWAKKVIDDGGHALNPSYSQIFKNLAGDKYDIKESIWEVEFWGNLLDQYRETTGLGYINGPRSVASSATGRADAYMSITAKFYDVYETGDLRKWYNIAHFTYNNNQINGDKTFTGLPVTQEDKYKLLPAKWRREYEQVLPKGIRTPINFPILRYADVLLMYAEAENAISGPTAEVVEIVNRVRRRAWSKGINKIELTSAGSGYSTAPTVTFSSGGGSGAKATATINASGQVTGITLNRDPEGITYFAEGAYTSAPQVVLSGGGGTGASATTTINNPSAADLKPAQTATKESMLAVIQNERLRELSQEGQRKADLLRWGIFLKTMEEVGKDAQRDFTDSPAVKYFTNVSQKDLLSPIPTSEITVNQAIKQNPGWD
ncbi:RagB/SusD family nutrient uptake outer membrane protein [Persicitalea sp.]|uniref:RagB/SusD family nutrient uptake outer membrane protein n=1 Tax=Persicitalea sp. TaxID=3100273 RepID=UPI00359388F8